MTPELKSAFYNKLQSDKVKINWNKNPIKMDLFLSFLTIEVDRSHDHLGHCTGWTQLFNKEYKLIVRGGRVDGVEYLDSIQYGTKLSNPYNNYVNPFYLFDILSKEGQAFFLDYYAEDIEKIIATEKDGIVIHERRLEKSKRMVRDIEQEVELLKVNASTKLKWWEGIREEGMPMFYKHKDHGWVAERIGIDGDCIYFRGRNDEIEWHVKHLLPATREEYENYINTKEVNNER